MPNWLTWSRATEILASLCTLAGMYLGSTTTWGATLYVAATFFWFVIMFQAKLWGLWPMNIAGGAMSIFNLIRSLV